MTNGEKIKEIFTNMDIEVYWGVIKAHGWKFDISATRDWWNAEYQPTTQARQVESDKFDAAYQDGYNCGYAQARFDYEKEPITKNNLAVDCISREQAINAVNMCSNSETILNLQQLPSVTPQLSSELEKNSKKLEKAKENLEVDCISRKRVLEWLENATDDSIEHAIDSNLEFIPSVTPQKPRKGHWIYKKFDERTGITNVHICSKCGCPLASPYKSFCSACGSDNREVKYYDKRTS